MTENMKKYLALISTDEAARKQLNEQEPSSIQEAKEKIIADAAVKGITLTEEDFADTGELSEDELNAVAGVRRNLRPLHLHCRGLWQRRLLTSSIPYRRWESSPAACTNF